MMAEVEANFKNLNINNDTLIFAHVIFRHGERNIVKPYPNDPYKDEAAHWPEGFGQITNEGKRQLFRLGQYLRRRYDKLIGEKYSPNKIYIQSTDFDRTIMSAQACLAGLYPPSDDEKWNNDINWQPIPVHTIPWNLDHVLTTGKRCPAYEATLENYMKHSQEVQRIYTEYAHLFEHWSQKSGSSITTLSAVYRLYDILITERNHNKQLSDWAKDAIQSNGIMESIVLLHLKLYADTPELAKLKPGFLIKEILERFNQKIDSKLQPDRSLWLYSAHDVTLSNVLNALGLFEKPHLPPYGASLHLELFKTPENKHYFQIFYRKSNEEYPQPMNIPGCGEKCSMDQFYHLFKNIIPGDFDTECRLNL